MPPRYHYHRSVAASPPTITLALGYNRDKVFSILQQIFWHGRMCLPDGPRKRANRMGATILAATVHDYL